jgi:hypothetical protein
VVRILKGPHQFTSPSLLPRCGAFDLPGRWLPAATARLVVINGASIPADREKYWAPYGCRSTFWDLAALKAVADRNPAAGGPCSTSPQEGGAAAALHSSSCPTCALGALRKVVFTGRSTTAVLMAALREHVLHEAHEDAKRDKDADHLREASGSPLAEARADLGGPPGVNHGIEFVTMPQTMPVALGRNRTAVTAERRQQIRDLVGRFKPSALVLHTGLHEVCGAYGPAYDLNRKNVGACASRAELMEGYEDYAAEVASLGLSGRTVFRSLMGGFPDVGRSGPWRWVGFADADPPYKGGGGQGKGAGGKGGGPGGAGGAGEERQPWAGNPCPAILGPVANAIFASGDAATAWGRGSIGGGRGVQVVDAFSPFHASPTRSKVMSDGLHPNTASVEALAVNQAIMNALCSMNSTEGPYSGYPS